MAKRKTSRLSLYAKSRQTIRKQQAEITELKASIEKMSKSLAKTSRKKLAKEVDETNKIVESTKKAVKKEHRFNIKAWLTTSIFAILSLLVGVANMIIHFVDKK